MILLIYSSEDKLLQKSVVKLFQPPYGETSFDKVKEISTEEINNYESIYIIGVTSDLQQLRNRYTGKLIGLYPFLNDVDRIITIFDSIYTSSYRNVSMLRKITNYHFAKYLPSSLSLIKNKEKPVKKSDIRIGISLPYLDIYLMSKIIKAVDNLASEGYTLIGFVDNNLETLQTIQKECPIFMIHTSKKNLLKEINKCTCIISGIYEMFWLAICHNVPVVPLAIDQSILSLSYEIGLQSITLPICENSIFSSKSLSKKVITCINRLDIYSQLQERYLIKSRLILGCVPKLNLGASSINKVKSNTEIKIINDVSLPIQSYFIGDYTGDDENWRITTDCLTQYNSISGIYLDPDVSNSLHLFEWVGIIKEYKDNLLENKPLIASLNMCRGLFVFSSQIKKQLGNSIKSLNLFKIPIEVIVYPVVEEFDINTGFENITVISDLPLKPILELECRYFQEDYFDIDGIVIFMFSGVDIPLSNGFLSRCICRNIPLILPHDNSYTEIIGESYPLFWNDLSEIPKLCQKEKIMEAVKYLKELPKDIFSLKYFINSIHTSKLLA